MSNNENQLVIYCEDDGEYRLYCDICDNLCIQRFYKNHLKSETHINNVRKIEEINKAFEAISLNYNYL